MSSTVASTNANSNLGLSDQRFQFCVIVIALAHLLVIFGISLKTPANTLRSGSAPVMEITLANTPSVLAPEKANMLANANQLSSSPKDSENLPKTLYRAVFPDQQIQEIWQPEQPEARISEPQKEEPIVVASHSAEKTKDMAEQTKQSNANLMSTQQTVLSQRISSLMAEFAGQQHHYAKLPRKRTVTAAAFSAEDAGYLYNWRVRVERMGNLHYPSAAKRSNLQGDVIMMVAVNADGSLHDVRVQQSSGSDILDNAAINIVKLSAPFQAFPSEVRKNTDILEIIRTWRFSGSTLITER